MWSRFTSALKPKEAQSSQSDIITKVHEQHPNMSMFQANEAGVIDPTPDVPPSPSVHSKMSVFKRMSRNALNDPDLRALPTPPGLPSKGKTPMDASGNGSQLSLGTNVADGRRSQDLPRRSSYDMLRPSPEREKRGQDTTRSVKDIRRPSIDFLRQDDSRPSSPQMTDSRANFDFLGTPADKYASTRSILRDKNTPGTGQNVRFNGSDAFKVITPDHSHSLEFQNKAQPPLPQEGNPFMDRLTEASASPDSPQAIGRSQSTSGSRSTHPSLGDIFAPLTEQTPLTSTPDQSDMSMSSYNHFVVEGNSNLFDVSQQLDIPAFPPPGLGFDVHSPLFEENSDHDHSQLLADGGLTEYAEHFTSTPYRKEDKGKGKEQTPEEFPVDTRKSPEVIDETIFHSQEKSPKLLGPLHERSQSFSAGQTLFYSMGNAGNKSNKSTPDSSAAYPSSDLKPESLNSLNSSTNGPSPPPSAKITRSRAMSDTVFQTMLKTKTTNTPEADINDESSAGLVVYSSGQSEPDPFSANAHTYYTPQTMIPTTPPKGTMKHTRKTSKEESIIMSLQTELSLKTELCAQYETDLKARDEMVEILSKKIADIEKDDAKRRSALRSWKKKVQELERACRMLEEAVEDSRQESMERSVMDSASGEALRMLHRQIASLEREKQEWTKKEASLHEDVQTLESLVKERTEDVLNLKESLWAHDESERELRHGIREAKEQIDMMGNISIGVIDEEEMKKLLLQKSAEDTQRFRTAEFALRQEVEEWKLKYENLEVEKASWEERLEHADNMLHIRDEEYNTLKSELEAQWERTEAKSERYAALVRERDDLSEERDNIKTGLEELEAKMSLFEAEWNEGENKRAELEAELSEVNDIKDALEKDRNELEDQLREAHNHIENLAQDIEERDQQITHLEDEQQFASDNIARLQANLKQRDEELAQQTQRIRDRQNEVEDLREEMSSLKREHNRLVNDQSRALEDATGQFDVTQSQMDEVVRAKAELEVQLRLARDRLESLQSENTQFKNQVKHLGLDSSDKDMKIMQLTKQYKQAKEDLEQINIALDSKQQELELIKRKLNARGTAASTPAPATGIKMKHRRDSSVFSATPASRPESALSDSGTDSATIKKKSSIDAASGIVSSRVAALAKSNKTNGISSMMPSATMNLKNGRSSGDGSMAPPLKPRGSTSDTPTPLARAGGLSRSSSIGTSVSPTQMRTPMPIHRRGSSFANGDVRSKLSKAPSTPRTVPEEIEEKENVDTGAQSDRRRNMVLASG